MGVLAEQENVVPAERRYAVIEVAEMWNLSTDSLVELGIARYKRAKAARPQWDEEACNVVPLDKTFGDR